MAQDLNRYFQEEAEDLLGRMAAALERGRDQGVTPEALLDLKRWAHTLKGAAQVVRRDDIAESAHRLETALEQFGEPRGGATLPAAFALCGLMRQALLRGPVAVAPVAEAPAPEVPTESLRVELRDLDNLLQLVNESGIAAAGLRSLLAPIERAGELSILLHRQMMGQRDAEGSAHADLLADELGDVIERAHGELKRAAQQMQHEMDRLRTETENLRLVRCETLVPVLEKSVQAAAAAAGKMTALEVTGRDLELDAHLLIGARDALIQLARNAVAHGIETPEERIAAGKQPAGRVHIEFRRSGTRSLISVTDDGRGVDFEALRREAVRRGWLRAREANQASAQQLTEYLFRSGVSTMASANALAGRGVGLDLVRSTVARMQGELRMTSEPGRGTTVTLRIPATMNSMPVLMLQAGTQMVGVPLDTVARTASIASLPVLADRYVVEGNPLAMIPLAAALGTSSASSPSIAVEIPARPRSFLLGVEGLAGIRQTVIHTLPDYLLAEPWILGASVEAEGNLRLVLDPAALADRLDDLSQRQASVPQPALAPLPILVVDDSLTTRMLEQSIFEMEGYAVDLASSAEEALTMARQRQYGLFLVDVEMPGIDGIAFVQRTRQDPQLRETPAILVTSRGSAGDRERGLSAGAREYFVKSEFNQRLLLKRVRELMRAQ
ncbi:MAG TPA: response regulator [Acidobacteriaceae bacterium]|jgi:two-component system chemotaxis sensor kinase CheA|nr:response regulator [Acidobacteriaceae bacterium]